MPPPPFNIAVPMNNGNCVERGRLYFATVPPLFHLFRASGASCKQMEEEEGSPR